MSSPVTQNVSGTAPVVETKARKPTLPEKYGKFVQFAYYMMDNILGDDFEMEKDAYLEKIRLFGSVEEQQTMVQGFLDAAKENKKTIRKVIADRKKAIAKANKPVKQPRAKKTTKTTTTTTAAAAAADDDVVANDNSATTTTPPAPKRTRKTTTKKEVQNAEEELLNEMVKLTIDASQDNANADPVVETKEDAKEAPKAATKKATKKTLTKKETKKDTPVIPPTEETDGMSVTNELVPEQFVTELEPEKPKRKQAKRTTKKAPTKTTVDTIPETDIKITPVTVSDTTYFKDANSNIYSYPTPTTQPIGTYNSDTNEFILAK